MTLHSHPGTWGSKYIFQTDRYLPQGFNRATFGYWANLCGAPFCHVVWLDPSFYEDATNQDLVDVARAMAHDGYVLHIPKERRARMKDPVLDSEERGYREAGPVPELEPVVHTPDPEEAEKEKAVAEIMAALDRIEKEAKATKRPRAYGEPLFANRALAVMAAVVLHLLVPGIVGALFTWYRLKH